DLIVSAPCCVQFRAGITNSLNEGVLNIHVHVLKRLVPAEFPGADFPVYFTQPGLDFLLFDGRNNSGFGERRGVSNRASYVLPVETAINRDGLAVVRSTFGERFPKSSFTHVSRALPGGSRLRRCKQRL